MSAPANARTFTRRRALLASGAAVMGVAVWSWFGVDEEAPVLAAIRKHFEGYNLDEDGVRRFVADYTSAEASTMRDWRWRVLAALTPVYAHTKFLNYTPMADYARYRAEEVIESYLRSTDILDAPADRKRLVRYLGLFDNVGRPCSNRLARFVDEDAQADAGPPDEGRRVFEQFVCGSCHSIDGTARVGPSLRGAGRHGVAHLEESVRSPSAKVAPGFESVPMPSYEGLMSDSQLKALLEYLQKL